MSDTLLESEDRNGYTIETHYDPEGATVSDHVGDATLWAWHRRYTFGPTPPCEPDEVAEHLPRGAVVLPVYLYDHSGIRLSTTGFSCPWDSGQVGVIWSLQIETRWSDRLKRVVKIRRASDRYKATIAYLRATVETLDAVVSGAVYGYVVRSPEGENVGSCWGFIGRADRDGYMIEQARAEADAHKRGTDGAARLEASAFAL